MTAPDGTAWTVRRHWLPRAARWPGVASRNRTGRAGAESDSGVRWLDGLDVVWIPDDGPRGWVVACVAVAVALVVLVAVVLPVVAPVVDGAVVVGLLAVAAGSRIALGRPWRISARSATRGRSWGVVGWRRSHKTIDAVADALASGNPVEVVDPTRALGARKS